MLQFLLKIHKYKKLIQLYAKNIMPKDNEKREKFVKLAENRTQLALDAIRKIGNLSNQRAYDYSDEDVKKIIKALREGISDTERKFQSSTQAGHAQFKL